MFDKEPAVVFGGIATLISLVIPMLIIFSILHWDEKQVAAVMGVVTFSANFLAVLLTRQQSVAKPVADRQIEIAKQSDPSTPTSTIIAAAAKENQ